jgi:hypothetical protein
MYSATARMSSSGSGSGGMPRSARLPLTIGVISSPSLSFNTTSERRRFGPPSWPPRRSAPWHAVQVAV